MIFYQLADGTLVGTQLEAKKSEQAWEQVDIPTDKQGLMDFLNQRPAPLEISAPVSNSDWTRCPVCDRTRRGAQLMAEIADRDHICALIRADDGRFLGAYTDAVIDKLKDLNRERYRDPGDQRPETDPL